MKRPSDLIAGIFSRFTKNRRPQGATVKRFKGSETYWEERYASGQTSGVGSYGDFAEFKAEILNSFVEKNRLASVIEFGCGDGNQLRLAAYPDYLGIDVSATAVDHCRTLFGNDKTRRFVTKEKYQGEMAELALSLDVIYHLVEDAVFDDYMRALFDASNRFVIIYSSNSEQQEKDQPPHVRHRCFSDWVDKNRPNWKLIDQIPNRFPYSGDYRTGSFADFFIFEKNISN
jgi:SAM-dependent methyltransferase